MPQSHEDEVLVRPSRLAAPQFADGLGVFAARSFAKGELVLRWNLRAITPEEYGSLPADERAQFTHRRGDVTYLYPDPERHVNRSDDPNVFPDFEAGGDVALKDIEPGDELTIASRTPEDGQVATL
ncbi:MAG: SET domain-containing protein [Nitrososphaerota archaeon]|nr:SET domain-containing protein [Nitrososphaerota archaeon]